MIELTLVRELMLIKRVHQKSVIVVTICIVLDKGIKFQTNICNGCHDILMVTININDIAISSIHDADYHCFVSGISKNDAVNLLQNAYLTEKR